MYIKRNIESLKKRKKEKKERKREAIFYRKGKGKKKRIDGKLQRGRYYE